MSTRATVHFVHPAWDEGKPQAIIYRHTDGYPDGLGADLYKFFAEVKRQTSDTRFDDPCYLAAKFVVWQASQFAHKYMSREDAQRLGKIDEFNEANGDAAYGYVRGNPLDFLSVGVMMNDPGDGEYVYEIIAGSQDAHGFPEVHCHYPGSTEEVAEFAAGQAGWAKAAASEPEPVG